MLFLVGCGKKNVETKETRTKKETTTTVSTTALTTQTPTTQKPALPLAGKVICVDAGHGIYSKNYKEKIAPNSSETKDAYAVGTKGRTTGVTEETLNLIVAKKLKVKLESLGAKVIMTRETAKSDMSNIDRAQLANNSKADLSIKIHANGSESTSSKGMLMMVPSSKYVSADVASKSKKAGDLMLKSMLAETGAKSLGVQEFSNMTGFNWSTVPIVMLEMGFMTNPEEDKLLNQEQYQNKIVNGISDGVLKYLV